MQEPVFDTAVIGAGFGGLAALSRLTAAGRRCALVEAGPDTTSCAQPDPGAVRGRGSADFTRDRFRTGGLGGTSALWNGVCEPIESSVTDAWPIDPDELAGAHREAAAWLGGALPIAAGRHQLAAADIAGVVDAQAYRPVRFALVGGGPLRLVGHRPSLDAAAASTVFADTRALAIEQTGSSQPLVVHTDGPTGRSVIAARSVVIACGVVGTYALLATSPTVVADARQRLLGRGLNAHLRLRQWLRPHSFDSDRYGLLRRYLTTADGLALGNLVIDINAMGEPCVDVMVEQMPRHGNRLRSARRGSTGTVIASSRFGAVDRRTVAHARTTLHTVAAALGADALRPVETRWFHPAGGVTMHRDSRVGLVDGEGRVHAERRVAVVGASTFPRSGAGNPTQTIVALAFRAADALLREVAG